MSKRQFILVSPEQELPETIVLDWSLCFICQSSKSNGKIISPFKGSIFAEDPTKSSYSLTAENLKQFELIGGLPPVLKKQVQCHRSSSDLAASFIENHAIFHKVCLSKYDKHKLDRQIKQNEEHNSSASPPETPRLSRKRANTKNFTDKCFFCGSCQSDETLHFCRTLYLDMRVRKIALDLADTELLAKLSEGDMVATEAKYHSKCLVKLYNRYRNHNEKKSADTAKIEFIQGNFFHSTQYLH